MVFLLQVFLCFYIVLIPFQNMQTSTRTQTGGNFPFAHPGLHNSVRNAVLDYTNPVGSLPLTSHHLLASAANQALHFPKLREQENLLLRQEAMKQARGERVAKKLQKLTPVQDFEECCNRYTESTHCIFFFFFFKWIRLFCLVTCFVCLFHLRKCITGFIPPHILKNTRENFLNFPNRAQRKAYMLHLRTPKCRYPPSSCCV